MTLTITKKPNFKERGNRGNEKKEKKGTDISFLVSAIILTTSTNTDFNISKLDKLYPKHV
jgi:hypothetical protein